MTFTGSQTDINAALNGLTYQPQSNFYGSDTLSITTNDLGNTGSGGPQTDTDTVPITVNPVNDAPVNTVPGPQQVNEDTPLVFAGSILVTDIDAGTNPVQAHLSVNNGTLSLNGTNGLTFTSGDGSQDQSMTFTGIQSDINTALNGLTFQPAANFNGATSITINANDQGNSGSGEPLTVSSTVPITVNPVNDAPVITVPGAQTVKQDTSLVFSGANGNQVLMSDLDAFIAPILTTLQSGNGTLSLGSTTGLTFNSGDGNDDPYTQFTACLTDTNAALNGMTYKPSPGYSGNDTVAITVNDQGNTGSGGPLTFTSAIPITITQQPKLQISAPKGGESWTAFSVQNIGWTSQGTVGDVKIEYSTNNGNAWTTSHANSTTNSGSYAVDCAQYPVHPVPG